ncbi:MAG: InlB B-repeat-containing protein, partial [Clostridia bacterium]|nr:InlB B-repeat-containing protein [Clostridia bacterium]
DIAVPDTVPAENITITAKWKVNSYKVTFLNGYGAVISEKDCEFGSEIVYPQNPEREGYTFNGWNSSAVNVPAEDITITAQWSINQYTITFVDTGDRTISPIVQNYGTAINIPANPTKTGHTFNGWDTEIPATMPAGDMTITAQWQVNKYTITFVDTGDNAIDAITQDYGTEVTKPSDPTRTGYTFNGWDIEIPSVMPANNVTVTAKWTINKYTITFADTGDRPIASIEQFFGTTVIAPANPTKVGHTFAGWDVAIPATMPGENVTITALWKINQYTITFNTDGGNTIADIKQDYNTSVTAPDNPTREGYSFTGWNKIIPTTMPAENIVITARWQINKYTVTFDVNGGTLDEEQPGSASGNYGTSFDRPADPARMGYTFLGWDVNGDGVIDDSDVFPETIPGRDLTVKAIWSINSYTVTFKDGYNDIPLKTDSLEYDSAIVYPTDPVREGYTFAGWDTEISNVPAKNTTITALWEVNEYTIKYYDDTLSGEAVLVKTEKIPYGESIPEYAYRPAGYSLLYWTLEGSSDPYQFPKTMPAENIELYAVLDLNFYKVTFINLGEKITEMEGFKYGDSVYSEMGEIGVESRTGYTFMGWFDADDTKYTEGYTVPDNEVVFTAKWEANKHEVTIEFTKDNGEPNYHTLDIAYDTPIRSGLPELSGFTVADGGHYAFKGWKYSDAFGGTEVPETMPDNKIKIEAIYSYTGWGDNRPVDFNIAGQYTVFDDADQYIINDEVQKTGWTEIDGKWYYLDPVTGLRATGLSRVSYPDTAINGVTYAPDPADLAGAEKYGYTDAETARFIFDENGVFQSDINGLYGDNWAVDGYLPWHV